MNDELTRNDFNEELIKFAAQCTELKVSTAKKYARRLFNKYEDLICYTKSGKDYHINQNDILRSQINTLKRGTITYHNSLEKTKGTLLIKNVEQIDIEKSGVKLTTKNGREIFLSKDFEYLRDII